MRRVWTPDCYRDGAVYEIVKALDEAEAIGDPDDLERLATAVADALAKRHVDFEGWLFIRGENRRVIEFEHSGDDDGYAAYTLTCELPEEDEE